MNLSSREWMLLGLTCLAVLIGGTFWLGEPMLQQLNERREQRSTLRDREKIAAYLLDQRDEIASRWDAIRSRMPMYPENLDVTSQLLKDLQRSADQFNLALLRVEPDDEENVGDLYEVSIQCSWEGTLDSLVKFLYKVQEESGMVDTRQLTITPTRSGVRMLKGNMVVDYAYSRGTPPPESGPTNAVSETVEIQLGD